MTPRQPYRPLPDRIDPPAKRWLQGEVPLHGDVIPPLRYETIHEWGEPTPVVAYRVRRPWGRIALAWFVGGAVIMVASCLPEIFGWLR